MARSTDPFKDIEELLDVMTGGMDSGGGPLAVDVADTGDSLVVVVDLPGYKQENIDVTLPDDTTLAISANRQSETVDEAERYVTRERQHESVSRRVGLPEPVDETETSAKYNEGVLTVTLAKRASESTDETEIPVE